MRASVIRVLLAAAGLAAAGAGDPRVGGGLGGKALAPHLHGARNVGAKAYQRAAAKRPK